MGRLKSGLVYLCSAVAVVALGWWVGSTIGGHRAESTLMLQQTQLQDHLERNIRGIERGEPFPDLAVWTIDGTKGFQIRDLLPSGGIFLLISPGCADCIDVVDAMQDAIKSTGDTVTRVVLVGNEADESRSLAGLMAERGIDLPIFCDVPQLIHRDYNVMTTPAYFCLDSAGVVVDFGAGRRTSSQFAELLRNVAPGIRSGSYEPRKRG